MPALLESLACRHSRTAPLPPHRAALSRRLALDQALAAATSAAILIRIKRCRSPPRPAPPARRTGPQCLPPGSAGRRGLQRASSQAGPAPVEHKWGGRGGWRVEWLVAVWVKQAALVAPLVDAHWTRRGRGRDCTTTLLFPASYCLPSSASPPPSWPCPRKLSVTIKPI